MHSRIFFALCKIKGERGRGSVAVLGKLVVQGREGEDLDRGGRTVEERETHLKIP